MSLLTRLQALSRWLAPPVPDYELPFWEKRRPHSGAAHHHRVWWSGSQAGSVPQPVREPVEFDPTR